MKKFISVLLMAGALAMTACKPTNYTSSGVESKFKGSGYTVTKYTYEEAKTNFDAFDYSTPAFSDALLAKKGSGDNEDLMLAFFFASVEDAEKFVSAGENKNLGLLNDFAAKYLGDKKRVGSHNNVAYAGSETSFNIAFN